MTFFCCMQSDAPSGGDTLVGSLVEAYERLSPPMKQFVCGLKAVHSSKVMAAKAARVGGANRRKEVESVHPVVYEQPVSSPIRVHRENEGCFLTSMSNWPRLPATNLST